MYKYEDLRSGPPNFPSNMAIEIYKAWANFAPDKRIPYRKDIDPLLIPKQYISSVWVYEYVPEKDSYRQVIAGQDIRDAWPNMPTEPFLEDFMSGETLRNIKQRWHFIRTTPAISYYNIDKKGDFKFTQRIVLPLCDEHGDISYVFGCSIYERLNGFETQAPPTDWHETYLYKID